MWTNHIRKVTSVYRPTLKDWLCMPIDDEEGVLKDGTHVILYNRDYVNYFINTIEMIIRTNNYAIGDVNRFREDITKYIYTLSDNSTHGDFKYKRHYG